MADGEYGYAFNEINFGAILPPSIRRVLVGIVGTREAERMLITGDAVPPLRALETRLADEVVAPDLVLATAVKHARRRMHLIQVPIGELLHTPDAAEGPYIALI
jgi:enoyl-CoA hydratase/carnithine racemase